MLAEYFAAIIITVMVLVFVLMTKSIAINRAALFTSLSIIACCVCPNVICAKVCATSVTVMIVADLVDVTKLCNGFCVCMLSIVSTCVCLNAVLCTSRSCCYLASVVMRVLINRNSLCVSIATFASECLNTGSCTSSSGSYGCSVAMSMRSNVFKCYLISCNGVGNKVYTGLADNHILTVVVIIPTVVNAVVYLELIACRKFESDSPSSLIFGFCHEMVFIDLPSVDSTLDVHLMCSASLVSLSHSSVRKITKPVNLICIISKVSGLASAAVVEDNLQACGGFNLHGVRPPAVVKLSSRISGPEVCLLALTVNPGIGVNGSPVGSVLEVNSYLVIGLVFFFATSASSCVLDSSFCFFGNLPFAVLMTGSSRFAIGICVVANGAGMSCITALCASRCSYNGLVFVSKCVNAGICISISAMTGVSSITIFCTCRSCYGGLVRVTCSRNCHGCGDCIATNRAVNSLGLTGICTSRINLRLDCGSVNRAKALFANLAVTCAVILMTCCRNRLCLCMICVVLTSVCLFAFGLAVGSCCNRALVPIVTDSRNFFCISVSFVMLASVGLNALTLTGSRSCYNLIVFMTKSCNLVCNVSVAARACVGCIAVFCTSRSGYNCIVIVSMRSYVLISKRISVCYVGNLVNTNSEEEIVTVITDPSVVCLVVELECGRKESAFFNGPVCIHIFCNCESANPSLAVVGKCKLPIVRKVFRLPFVEDTNEVNFIVRNNHVKLNYLNGECTVKSNGELICTCSLNQNVVIADAAEVILNVVRNLSSVDLRIPAVINSGNLEFIIQSKLLFD